MLLYLITFYYFRLTAGKRKKGEVRFTVPCLFHNLSNFDAHLLLCAVRPRHVVGNTFNCIPKTMEKYVSFTIGLIDYRDSLQFTLKSLERLVSLLKPEVYKPTVVNV